MSPPTVVLIFFIDFLWICALLLICSSFASAPPRAAPRAAHRVSYEDQQDDDDTGGGDAYDEEDYQPPPARGAPPRAPVHKPSPDRAARPPPGPAGGRMYDDDVDVGVGAAMGGGARVPDRPLPTLSKKAGAAPPADEYDESAASQGGSDAAREDDGTGEAPPLGDPEPLTPANEKDAGPLLELVDELLVRGLYSKIWNHRESALKTLRGDLGRIYSLPDVGARRLYRVILPLIRKLLSDKVPQVFLLALDLFQSLLNDFAGDQRKEDIQRQVEPLLGALVKRVDDANARARQAAVKQCITISLPRHAVGSFFVAPLLLKPLKINASPTSFESRSHYLLQVSSGLGDVHREIVPVCI